MLSFSKSSCGVIAATASFAAIVAVLVGTPNAYAQGITTQTIYNNTVNYSGSAFANGGAAGTTFLSTTTVMDDITLATNATGPISGVSFSVTNFATTSTKANVILSFYSVGSNGLPGTIIGELNFNPITFGTGTAVYTYNPGTTIFTTPGTSFWVGETFTNSGETTTTTAAGLNALGEGLFNPPTVGNSNDYFYQSTSTGTSAYGSSNPAGNLLYFGGSPVANFGFAFTGSATAPEPSALALLIPGALAGAGGLVRRRRTK